jgi:hypothetical protein
MKYLKLSSINKVGLIRDTFYCQSLFKNSVLTAKKTTHFTITNINWLTLFKEMIAVYSENHMKPLNAELLNIKVGCTYIYHSALKE